MLGICKIMAYALNPMADISVTSQLGDRLRIQPDWIIEALEQFDRTMLLIGKDIPVNIFEILGMRNLSSFVGEVFAKQLEAAAGGLLMSNPHQDGYPDLLINDDHGKKLLDKISSLGMLSAKEPFSPFTHGGIEVKATCGSVPTPAKLAKKGLFKPGIGDPRISMVTSYDWKAHHRETNNLLGIFWDFSRETKMPFVAGTFFSNDLEQQDWGPIVQPREGGGRTTSVSIMARSGIYKMYSNWIAVDRNPEYANLFNRKNRSSLMSGGIIDS
jgi:hypothetical protein